ncbi:hypothetical protein [Streptomyces violaceorubidus]|uniref:hypothetical protein n=1 Tax=Streptomyces violaceorubidus TaxID=284042 RepID=UPI0004C008F9|nr:hypothetical protein [Streptomyces violaceorubidus]
MEIAVIGGRGSIGSRIVENLNAAGHRPVPHSLSTGVDVASGEGAGGHSVRLPATPPQPVAANDVAAPVAEVGGPDVFFLDDLGRLTPIRRGGDGRTVVAAHPAPTRYTDWLS